MCDSTRSYHSLVWKSRKTELHVACVLVLQPSLHLSVLGEHLPCNVRLIHSGKELWDPRSLCSRLSLYTYPQDLWIGSVTPKICPNRQLEKEQGIFKYLENKLVTCLQLCLLIPGAADTGAGAEETLTGSWQWYRDPKKPGKTPKPQPCRAKWGGHGCPSALRWWEPHSSLTPCRSSSCMLTREVFAGKWCRGETGEWERFPSCRGDLFTFGCSAELTYKLHSLSL